MKKSLLKIVALASISFLSAGNVSAQTPLKDNIAANIGGTRFVITAPSSITGIKKVTIATWGAAASPTITNAPIEKAYDTLAAAALLNNTGSYPSLTGKFALVYRGGGINFTDKVIRCQAAGAVGVIIVNNIPGDPIAMGAVPTTYTTTIPVVMVSDVDGNAINSAVKSSPAGTVKLTLGTWNTGGTHDLGIMDAYQATPHAMNIPLHQLMGSAGTEAFKHYIGGAVANYGTATETAITVTDSVFWTPTSGTKSFLTKNSYTIPSISVADSIKFGFGSGTYSLTPPTTTGKYDHKYTLSYDSTDDFPQDNVATLTQNVTDSIYCKGNYDFVNARPSISLGIRPGTATPTTFIMGNTFYIKNKGFSAEKIQFSLSHDVDPTLVSSISVTANIYKWVDGDGGDKDSVIQSGELVGVGTAGKIFNTADSSGKTITLKVLDFKDPSSTTKRVFLNADTWYFVAVEVPAPLFIGVDKSVNFFTRSYAQWVNAGSIPGKSVWETPTALVTTDILTFNTTATNVAAPFPFSGNAFFIDSSFYDRFNEISSVALIMSKSPTSILNYTNTNNIGTAKIYPNPSTQGSVTVDVALTQKSNKVVYRLTDILGRTLYSEVHNDVLKEKFEINTSQYANGTYYIMIITDNGLDNKKITIQN
ncbi:MAG: T9SS type A sorting domain-containing protein [Phycisphaerales bacterium]|nr:T9SS type A sorting domain-containing protein [Phycisphaerales bacterium]